MNTRVESNIVPLKPKKSINYKFIKEHKDDEINDVFSIAFEEHYIKIVEAFHDEAEELSAEYIESIDCYFLTMPLLMHSTPDKFTDEEHWRLIYMLSLSEFLQTEELMIDLRSSYLIKMMLKAEKSPSEFVVNGKIVSFPYSIYMALAAFHNSLGDSEEAFRWTNYGRDRIESFIPDRPKQLKSRIFTMLENGVLYFDTKEETKEYSPFILETKDGLLRFLSKA